MNGAGRGPRRAGSSAVGAALVLSALALLVLGAGADRPAPRGDGVWTTPLLVVVGLVGGALLVVLGVVLWYLPGGSPRPGDDGPRSRWLALLATGTIAFAVLTWLGDGERDASTTDGGAIAPLPDTDLVGATEPPLSTTALVGGSLALALLLLLALGLVRRLGHTPAPHGSTAGVPSAAPSRQGVALHDGTPGAVVLAAWEAARDAVLECAPAGRHEPPGALLRRVGGTPLASPLGQLTELYLPVRYGRAAATPAHAAAARHALAAVRAATGASAPHDTTSVGP